MKRETFIRPGISIETWYDGARHFICWRPGVSVGCGSRKEVLSFIGWPAKTPTGDALRLWLTEIEAADAKRSQPAEPQGLTPELLETGWGPETFDNDNDPTANTQMVI